MAARGRTWHHAAMCRTILLASVLCAMFASPAEARTEDPPAGGTASEQALSGEASAGAPQSEGFPNCPPGADPQALQPVTGCADSPPPSPPVPERRHRLFPLAAGKAIERGYRIPEPWGLGIMTVHSSTQFVSHDLSAAVSKGSPPAADASLIPLPSVTTRKIEGKNTLVGFKGDLWILPGVNVFASLGKVKGNNQIDVAIDLDALIPRPFCRPAKPCGVVQLPVDTKVDNTTITVGTLLVYGTNKWFVLASIAKTVSISSKERSDVRSTNLGLRGGPRFAVGRNSYFAPYIGVNYFDLENRVRGVVTSGPLFEDGDPVSLRYEVTLKARKPWAGVFGGNLELTPHFGLQAELQAGATSTRVLATATLRL